MSKLLVNTPSGAQELIEVTPSGGYFDPARILWDERLDGAMPSITLGGMVRTGNTLTLDSALLSASQAANKSAVKLLKWDAIKAERDRRTLDGGCKVGANWFLSTERARGEYTSMAIVSTGAPATYVIVPNWRTMQDGVTVDMTVGLLKQIMTAGLLQASAIDTVAQNHRAAVNASATPETYNYMTGWPATFDL